MSLDVYLTVEGVSVLHLEPRIFIREGGQNKEISREEWDMLYPGREPVTAPACIEDGEVYHANITSNLGKMADKAGIWIHLWEPNETGITTAKQLVEPLNAGLNRLKSNPSFFKQFNPPNGWGTYDGLVQFVEDYLNACERFPEATIRVSR